MKLKLMETLERMFTAAAFAEAGEQETASRLLEQTGNDAGSVGRTPPLPGSTVLQQVRAH